MRKLYNPSRLHLIFVFYFFIILKLIYFIKNKNIMNFYKLFIKNIVIIFLEEILIIIFIYIKK